MRYADLESGVVKWEGVKLGQVLGRTAKKYASHYLQLKVRHGIVGTYLAKIGIIETPQYW